MASVLLKAFAFVFIIILGYLLKRVGFFSKQDYGLVSKIVLNVTLPAAVITSFSDFQMQNSLLIVVLLGLLCNIIPWLISFFAARKKENVEKAFYLINSPGYNIGCFTMPYVQSFLGAFGVIVTCMFDVGNAIMCTGGNYALTSAITAGEKNTLSGILKKLFSSIPFDTYVLMLILGFFGISVPEQVASVTSVIGQANGFLAMLMIGIMFEIKMDSRYLKQAAGTLLIRYGSAVVFALLFFFCTPFSLEIRQVMAIAVFSPVTSLAPVFTDKCKGDPALSSFTSSISIIISIAVITALLTVMNV